MTSAELTYSVSGLAAAVLFGLWLGMLIKAALRSWPR